MNHITSRLFCWIETSNTKHSCRQIQNITHDKMEFYKFFDMMGNEQKIWYTRLIQNRICNRKSSIVMTGIIRNWNKKGKKWLTSILYKSEDNAYTRTYTYLKIKTKDVHISCKHWNEEHKTDRRIHQ